MSVYFEMTLIAILDTKRGSPAIASGVPESFAAFALFQKPGEAEWERLCSPSLRFISGFGASLLWHANVVNLSKIHSAFQFS